jgi:PAS domain S-box-containing protein
MKTKSAKVALLTSLIYAFIGSTWILLSGRALFVFVSNPDIRNRLEIYKGWAFVAVTALLLYLILRSQLQRMEQEAMEREQAEKALSESDERFHALVEQAADAFFVHDRNGRILDVNRCACESLGYAKDKLLQMNMLDFEQDFNLTGAQAVWDRIQPGEALTLNGRHRRRNGTNFPVEVRLGCFDLGGQRFFSGLARDVTERKRVEEAIRENELRLRTVVQNAPAILFIMDREGVFRLSEGQALAKLGLAPGQVVGKSALEMYKDVPSVVDSIRTALSGTPTRVINELPDAVFDTAYSPIFDPDGKPAGLIGIAIDITDRRRKEHRLKRLTDCFLSFGTDPAENINRMTALCGELLGATCALYNRLEGGLLCSLGQWNPPPDYVPQDKPEGHICYDVIRRRSEDLFIVRNLPETRYFKSDPNVARYHLKTYVGKAVLFSNAAVGSLCVVFEKDYEPDAEDRRIFTIIAAAIGIEENRLQAREKLRTREESYRALADNVPDSVARIDRDLRFVYVNRTLEEALHLPAAAILSKTNVELNLPAQAAWNAATQAVFDTDKPQSFEFEAPGPDETHYLEVRLVPERSATGKVEFVLALTRDVTEQKKAEAERQKLETQLRQSQKMEAFGQLAAGVAHDFNNILTVIEGNASLLLNPELHSAEKLGCSRQIIQAAERAASLTRQLLMFSRKHVLQTAQLDLNEVVGNMTKMLQRILGEDISLRAEYAPKLPVISADEGMLEQVLLNLAVNSRDAMPKGGQLLISTSVENFGADSPHLPAGASPGNYVCLKVSDTGCGIPPEILPHIFEPFFTTKEIGKGTGLGLATVYGIVQQHYGWVTVTSQVGQGTIFYTYLPAVKGAPANPQAAATAPKLPGGNETILVVEDELAVRTLVGNLLRRCGYTVLVAESGVAALDVWKEHRSKIQLLLTDMIMPDGMTGHDLAQLLKSEQPQLKVIYTSGYSADIFVKNPALIRDGNFLQKPYHPHQLAQTVRNCLDQKQRDG